MRGSDRTAINAGHATAADRRDDLVRSEIRIDSDILCAMKRIAGLLLLAACATAPAPPPQPAPVYEFVLRNGMIYDGSGGDAIAGDVAIRGDRIAAVGHVNGRGKTEIDVHGLAIAPGFINVMSQAQETLIADGRGM